MRYKFKMYDWDLQKFRVIPIVNTVDAIHYAWNYEFDTYDRETGNIVLSRLDDNKTNNEWLKEYGLRLIDHDGYRKLQSIETDEIFDASWH